jgi:hypothetical protein
MRDPSSWTLIPAKCRRVFIDNVKLIGLWRYNADGIDVVNSADVTIRRCFLRTFDDAIVLKGLKSWGGDLTDTSNVSNILAEECVIWCDWGRALEIGAETCADRFDDIIFRNCDIIRTTHVALDIQHGDRARIKNVLFEDIRVEMDDCSPKMVYQSEPYEVYTDDGSGYCPQLLYIGIARTMWSNDTIPGSVDGVVFRNITAASRVMPESIIFGADGQHLVENVTLDNLVINGKRILSAEEANLKIGDFTNEIMLKKE